MAGLGHKSYVQFGPKETTYGTFVTPTKKLEVVSWSVAPQVGVIQDPSLYNAQSRRGLYQGGLLYKGTFVVRLNYEGLEELFRGVFGTYSNTVVSGAIRDHFFKEGATLNSYSFEVIVGDIPTGKCFRLLGSKLTGLTVRGTSGVGTDAMLQAEFTVVAKDMTSNNNPTAALSFPSVFPVLYHQATTVDDGTADTGANLRVRAFEVSLESPHAEDRFYLGSVNIDEPLRSDFLTARFRLTQEFKTQTQFDAARAFTVGSPQLTFRHPTDLGGGFFREFELRANQANLVEFSNPIEGYGVLISTATWEAFYDVTDASALVARFRNNQAALT
jgi:hypothetical protein